MPDLSFVIAGVQPAEQGLTPLLDFRLQVTNANTADSIQGVILHVQIQFQPAGRPYSPIEKERLIDLFGTPDRWSQTLRNRLWAHAHTTLGAFSDRIETRLLVPCTYDLNIAATKYFYALDAGGVPLLFLFSGTIFYTATDGRLQIKQIPWTKESMYLMPAKVWHELMSRHYPNSAWISMQRDVFDRLYEFKRRQGIPTWEQVFERLLPEMEGVPL